jgi:hypothetical protein
MEIRRVRGGLKVRSHIRAGKVTKKKKVAK